MELLKCELCGSQDCSDGHSWGPGVRRNYILHYIVRGAGYYETGGKKYRVEAGESFFINDNSMAHYYPDMNDPWSYFWIIFSGSEAKSILSMTSFFDIPLAPKADLEKFYSSFLTNVSSKTSELYNDGLLRMLLAKYLEIYPSNGENKYFDYMHIAKHYIATNFHRYDFTVTELAQAVGIERSYLYRLFKENENMSIIDYIIDVRLENAKKMMENGMTQIKVIAYSSGYENPLYFSNAFKKKYGISPKNYLKTL